MAISIRSTLDILAEYGIRPGEDDSGEIDLPGIGDIDEGESVYSTSLERIFRLGDELEGDTDIPWDDPRLREWQREIERIIEQQGSQATMGRPRGRTRPEPPEPHCAWYCPIHYFGHGAGIYIRESCVLSHALDIATFVDWSAVRMPRWAIGRHLLRSAFYVFFLHEQFHHKIESLGFRLLVSTGTDRYRPYKTNVYRPTFMTSDCLEESLANAESYRRLGEDRYVDRIDPAFRKGLRRFLKASIRMQPPGYREGLNYLSSDRYRTGLHHLQSQVLDGRIPPTTRPGRWSIVPNMITSFADIADQLYFVLPRGARPIFSPTGIDPGATVSSRALETALNRHYGYATVAGGKGSHVKLRKAGAPTIVLPGNRPTLSPGIVKQVLDVFGGHPLSRLPDLLEGRLALRA